MKTNQRILEKERGSIRGEYKRRKISISSGTKLLLPDRITVWAGMQKAVRSH